MQKGRRNRRALEDREAYPWLPGNLSREALHKVLFEGKRAQLGQISSIAQFKKGEKIYSDGEVLDKIFVIITGTVAAYKKSQDGKKHIVTFLYPKDLFGLWGGRRYIVSTEAITPVVAYSFRASALRQQLSRNPKTYSYFVTKICDQLSQNQDHALLLSRLYSSPKLAMFLNMQRQAQLMRGESTDEIYLPMRRTDIAEYLGLSLAALSRTFSMLSARRIIKIRNRRHVIIINRKVFEKLANGRRTRK